MRKLIFILLLFIQQQMLAQSFFTVNKDSTAFALTIQGASHLASLPLKCLQQQYPNKINHTASGDSDQVLTPKNLHPAFYGCFDWHSSVHGHWMLIKLLKDFPSLPENKKNPRSHFIKHQCTKHKKRNRLFYYAISKKF